jgi:hypothetical protein
MNEPEVGSPAKIERLGAWLAAIAAAIERT